MKCPACNATVVTEAVADGVVMYCSRCGWGRDRAYAARPQEPEAVDPPPEADPDPAEEPNLGWVLLGAAWSAAGIAGPYAALVYAFAPLPLWVHLTYGCVLGTYLFFAATITPSFDRSNLGLFGTTIDNPFSWGDDVNRAGLFFALLLLPGKAAWWAARALWRRVRG